MLLIGAAWGAFTTFLGVAGFFDLATSTKMNPVQFLFAFVLTTVIFGFVIASHIVWSFKSDDIPTLMMKVAWMLCVLIVFYAALRGTRQFVFGDGEVDIVQRSGLVLVTFLVVAASILLSKLLLAGDIRGKPFLF